LVQALEIRSLAKAGREASAEPVALFSRLKEAKERYGS